MPLKHVTFVTILYKRHEKSRIRAYDTLHEFMDEQGRQSALEHFVNAYPERSPEKQKEVIRKLRCICDDIKTVELAQRYYNVLGKRAKKFLGFAMLQFNETEVSS